jgi:2-keto-4-pentenoate hydratase/2-oxohepta-3-ene-1,7-dioic acid hydratase in catechol pathway
MQEYPLGNDEGLEDMKIARIQTPTGHRSWAVVDPRARTLRRIVGSFSDWAPRAATAAPDVPLESQSLRLDQVRLLAPVEPGGRIFGVGMNYPARLRARGRRDRLPHPVAYLRPDSAVLHPGQEIRYPAVTRQLDFGLELVAVVARRLGEEPRATACLLGYTIGNDISARDAGEHLGVPDLFTEKALDRTAPIGPWVTTLDEFGGPGQPQIDITMRVNTEVRQFDNTGNMIFSVDELLNFIDIRVALQAGDVVFTGTTSGVGLDDGGLLQPGDRLESQIERIGVLRNVVGAKEQPPPVRLVGRLGLPFDRPVRTPRRRGDDDRENRPDPP